MLRCLVLLAAAGSALAETGIEGWLRYAKLPDYMGHHQKLPETIVTPKYSKGSPLESAASELQKGFSGMLGKKLDIKVEGDLCHAKDSIVVATLKDYEEACHDLHTKPELTEDGFHLEDKSNSVLIIGENDRGALYGAFEYLSKLGQADFSPKKYTSNPDAPIRWANQWDNLDASGTHGSVERGYGGPSIFFDPSTQSVREDLSRVPEYGRLLASIGINGIIINNVNADQRLLNETNLPGVKKIADLFRPWGVKIGMSLNFASPKLLGDLDTFDPLDDSVIAWWNDKTDKIYDLVPDFLGYLVKANSEGQPGPLTYNRTLAEGANLFARAAEKYGGIVMFRAFVYDQVNETDWHADRANAAVEFFKELDGKFDDNVIVQIKYGPIDFQVREPASPLFANIPKTSVAIELQITQEYLGEQCHLVYLPPLWRTILDWDMRYDGKQSYVRDIVAGRTFNRKLGGYVGVANVGMDNTWMGSHMSMSNLYAFGRLAWNPTADSKEILQDWIKLTFGLDRRVEDAITDMSMKSWHAYESYSGNLGEQTLADITYTHYGPDPASMDNNAWGQWTRADRNGIGMDRSVWNGTGFAGQYPKEVAAKFEYPETTPDDLMLWFHHVPYTFKLHSGKTVIQHFYDAHYEGAATANTFADMWETLKGRVDDQRFQEVLFRLQYQGGHSITWRDSITEFYRNLSGIPDAHNRVRNHKYRIEAEDMDLDGFTVVSVFPTQDASKYHAIATNGTGTATTKINSPDGTYNIAVNYYDTAGGASQYEATLNGKTLGKWSGNAEDTIFHHELTDYLDAHSAIRITFKGIHVRKGDELVIKGTADGREMAAVDYVSILPEGIVD